MRWTVDRLMDSAWASLTRVAAISSRVQPLTGRSCSWVWLVAIEMTAMRSEGGKAPGSAGAGEVVQALQALGDEAFAPLAHGVTITAEFGGDLLVGWAIIPCGPQDDATAEGQRLRGGARPDEGLELVAGLVRQYDSRTEGARHGWPPGEQDRVVVAEAIMATHAPVG